MKNRKISGAVLLALCLTLAVTGCSGKGSHIASREFWP